MPRAKKKKKKRIAKTPDDASPFVVSGEGTLPERGRDGEKAVRGRPRTSLGDGVVRPGGRRIDWAQLLRRVDWVDGGVTMITIPMEGIDRTFAHVFDLARESSIDAASLPQPRPLGAGRGAPGAAATTARAPRGAARGRAPRAASVCAADGERGVRRSSLREWGTGQAGAEGAGDVARAKVCREDDVREVRGSLV